MPASSGRATGLPPNTARPALLSPCATGRGSALAHNLPIPLPRQKSGDPKPSPEGLWRLGWQLAGRQRRRFGVTLSLLRGDPHSRSLARGSLFCSLKLSARRLRLPLRRGNGGETRALLRRGNGGETRRVGLLGQSRHLPRQGFPNPALFGLTRFGQNKLCPAHRQGPAPAFVRQ